MNLGVAPPSKQQLLAAGLDRHSGSVITPDLVERLQSLYDQYAMVGQQPPFEVPEVGADATEYLTNLYFGADSGLATELAVKAGINRDDFLANVRRVNDESQARRRSGFNPLQRTLHEIGEETEPLTKAALIVGTAIAGGAAAAGLGGGGAAGAGGAGAGGTAATTYPLATGGTVTATPLAAETLAPIALSPSVAPISSPVGAAWAAPGQTAASTPAATSFGPEAGGGFFDKIPSLVKRIPKSGFGFGSQQQPRERRPVYQSQPPMAFVSPAQGPALTTKRQMLADMMRRV